MMPFIMPHIPTGQAGRQPASMVLEFPAPHIAILKPSPIIARTRKFGAAAATVAALVAAGLVVMIVQRPGHDFRLESESLQHIFTLVLPMFIFGVIGLVIIMRGTLGGIKRIIFDRRQGMVYKEARKLDPIWQGGIRLRDVTSLELTTTTIRGMTFFALELVMSRPQGEKVRLIAHGNREAMKADAGELARFLSIPLADRMA
jgi:hypothetical protein